MKRRRQLQSETVALPSLLDQDLPAVLPAAIQGQTNPTFDQCDVRCSALQNIFQFRDTPITDSTFDAAVVAKMQDLRLRINRDLENHVKALNPRSFAACSSCGHDTKEEELIDPSQARGECFLNLLQHKLYQFIWSGENRFRVCRSCSGILSSRRVPITAMCKGWPFSESVPACLSTLTRYESILIAIRLPCVYSWRGQGGFGQNATRGTAVSFSNPVADLANVLPRRASAVFKLMLENGKRIDVDSDRVKAALVWLTINNPLYSHVSIDPGALKDISSIQSKFGVRDLSVTSESVIGDEPGSIATNMSTSDTRQAEIAATREEDLGSQGPLDGEGLILLSQAGTVGVEEADNMRNANILIQQMLRPFQHRRNDILPSYDACRHIESYFPTLFPYGRGGPFSTNLPLGTWVKHVLAVRESRFACHVDFTFVVHSVLRHRRLTGLSSKANLRDTCTSAIVDVREPLSARLPREIVAKRIDKLLRIGVLSASFETLRGSPAFWASLRKTSWAYLTHFGPCQIFLTLSVADLIDPYVFMQIDRSLTIDEARAFPTRRRADLLANNPGATTTIFHRRVQSLFDNFLCGESSPFLEIEAFLGRVEQQARHSPHLHLLVWLKQKAPTLSGDELDNANRITRFVEMFCTALLPSDILTPQSEVPPPVHKLPLPVHSPVDKTEVFPPSKFSGDQRHSILSSPTNINAFDGSAESNADLRRLLIVTQTHTCNNYCSPGGKSCRFLFPFKLQPRGSIAARSAQPSDKRQVALAPRGCPHINSTHPMLTAMFHSNTDVTIVTGNSVAESAYVCNYAVKADKNPLFDPRALKKLQTLRDGLGDDRKLLAAIARNSQGVRTVGAQEAVDTLLGNPLTFESAKVKTVSTKFLLQHEGAMSDIEEASRNPQDNAGSDRSIPLLSSLDRDSLATVGDTNGYMRQSPSFAVWIDPFPAVHESTSLFRAPHRF